jgi:ActR/RegA family two-component response regulator/REP element-mobilizing transposase RayT
MTANLLLVTPSTNFGETVRRALEETDLYNVYIVNNKASAVVRADEEQTLLAILDLALGEDWVLEIGQALRAIRPEINLVILCGDDNTPPSFDSIRPWALLRKPFTVADFMKSLNQPPIETHTPLSSDNPVWLTDVSKAAQHLTRLTLESSAQAALITRNGDVWAYAGGLAQNAAKEVAQTVSRNWDGQKGSDLLRFIRLESTRAEHMLYATRIAADVVLALVFDAETPFSTIRSQANQLVMHLGDERPESQKTAKSEASLAFELSEDRLDEDTTGDIPSITDILNNIPAPNPEPASLREPDQRKIKTAKLFPEETRMSTPLSNATVFNRREVATSGLLSHLVTSEPSKDLDQTIPSQARIDEVDLTVPSKTAGRPAPGELDLTRPGPTTDAARKITLEPVSAGLYHLAYACMLVPRFTSHYLTGDMADHLAEWLPKICVAFGWRLEYLAVRPEYLQWVVNVQPNTSPGYLMRIMRQQTSEKIFADFARIKKENPSGDFWAPGYLIMGGSQPHPPQLVRDYIRQTRQRQGQEASRPGS